MKTLKTLPIPSFFDPANARSWGYSPKQDELAVKAVDWRKAHKIAPTATDTFSLHLLLIDVQKDFCFPEGSLYVGGRSGTGAMDDNRRIAEFIYRNLGVITNITTTLDTHFAHQIFFAPFWVDDAGEALSPHTLIDVGAGGGLVNTDLAGNVIKQNVAPHPAMAKWLSPAADGSPNYTWLKKQVQFYVEELKRGGKYGLYLWPEHCILGSDGHPLAGIIHEARMFHAFTRVAQSYSEVKGGNALTENYSVLRPEVLTRWDGKPLGQKNVRFINTLLASDAVIIAGQAASHCVKSTIDDLLDEIRAVDPNLARKVYILGDGTSAVAVPNPNGGFFADFTDDAEKALKRFSDAGMHVVKSTDPLDTWPDLRITV